MKLNTVCEKYKWNKNEIAYYVKHGVIGLSAEDDAEISDNDIDKICLINLFHQIGLGKEKILTYLSSPANKDVQIRLLRETRDDLLDAIHDKQKLLDKIDYILHQLQKGAK